jgi:nucleotide-binding universal stress UspA family protein
MLMHVHKLLILLDLGDETPALLDYGVQLAQSLGAQAWIQHVFYIPPAMAGELFIPTEAIQQYQQQVREQLAALQAATADETGLDLYYEASYGELLVEMNQLIHREHIDLVVIGNRGGGASDNILGSNTLRVIHRAICPVLSVPSLLYFRPIKRIALATDWQQTSPDTMARLVSLARQWEAHLDIIHVGGDRKKKDTESETLLDRPLSAVPHTFYQVNARDIEEGIQQHVDQYHSDLIALIPRSHGFFDRLFQKSVTRQMVYQTQTPLLTLPE